MQNNKRHSQTKKDFHQAVWDGKIDGDTFLTSKITKIRFSWKVERVGWPRFWPTYESQNAMHLHPRAFAQSFLLFLKKKGQVNNGGKWLKSKEHVENKCEMDFTERWRQNSYVMLLQFLSKCVQVQMPWFIHSTFTLSDRRQPSSG